MASKFDNPLPPPVKRSTVTAPDAPTTIIAPDLHPPQKFKRPLPQPGDSDYVSGQPIDEEEASRVEKEDQERFDRGQALVKAAATRSKDIEKD